MVVRAEQAGERQARLDPSKFQAQQAVGLIQKWMGGTITADG
jgi:hypothetical protein